MGIPVYRADGTVYYPDTNQLATLDMVTGQEVGRIDYGAYQALLDPMTGLPKASPLAPTPEQEMTAAPAPTAGAGYGGYQPGGVWNQDGKAQSIGDQSVGAGAEGWTPSGAGAPIQMGSPYPRYTGNTPAPQYANGALHPFFGGQMPQSQGDGSGGGPAPLPYVNHDTPRPPGSYSGGGGGGDGGDFARQMRGKLLGKMMGSGYGGSTYGEYDDDPYDPYAKEKMRGFAKGMDPEQAASLFYRPQMLIPKAINGMDGIGADYDLYNALPATELAYLTNGGRKSWDGGPNDLANGIGGVYEKAAGDGEWFDWDDLSKNLMKPAKGSGLDELFATHTETDAYGNEYKTTPAMGDAAYAYQGMLEAAINTTLPPLMASGMSGYGDWLINLYGSKFAGKKPEKAPPINRWVGKRLER